MAPGFENIYVEILTKYTAPKLPWPISRKSEKSFSGSSLKKSSAISGSFRLPARLLLGIMGSWGAMPLPPATISVCDSDLKAPTDGSSAGQWSHMCSALKVQGETNMNGKDTTSPERVSLMNSSAPCIKYSLHY